MIITCTFSGIKVKLLYVIIRRCYNPCLDFDARSNDYVESILEFPRDTSKYTNLQVMVIFHPKLCMIKAMNTVI